MKEFKTYVSGPNIFKGFKTKYVGAKIISNFWIPLTVYVIECWCLYRVYQNEYRHDCLLLNIWTLLYKLFFSLDCRLAEIWNYVVHLHIFFFYKLVIRVIYKCACGTFIGNQWLIFKIIDGRSHCMNTLYFRYWLCYFLWIHLTHTGCLKVSEKNISLFYQYRKHVINGVFC